jgi:GDP-L-fucose synthase
MIKKKQKIFVAGNEGFVGSAIVKRLKFYGYKNILVIKKKKLDLTNQSKVFEFIKKEKPIAVIIAAARTGGIYLNSHKGYEILYDNLSIQNNLIKAAQLNKIKYLIFLASNVIYPENCKQPMREEFLLKGPLQKSHEPFSIAKIAGIKLCQLYNKKYKTNYKTLVLPNIYGPGDNYNYKSSSFFPALIRKIYKSKIKNKSSIYLWGNGKAKREIIYVNDVADACIFFLNKKNGHDLINIGTGTVFSIQSYAKFIMKELNVTFKIKYKGFKENGMLKKKMNINIARKSGWRHKVNLEEGFRETFQDFLSRYK